MLGVWMGGSSGGVQGQDRLTSTVNLQLSPNSPEYVLALEALAEVEPHNAASYFAVVSLRYCSMFGRLVAPRRVWLSIFCNETGVASYSHIREQHAALCSFLSTYPQPVLDKSVWRTRFAFDINAYWETLLAKGERLETDGSVHRERALAALGRQAA